MEKLEKVTLNGIPTIYDTESMSVLEVAGKAVGATDACINKINECVDKVNECADIVDAIPSQTEITNSLRELSADGTISHIINNDVLDNKVNKSDTAYITMDKLAQDVKQAMTGGSVAVVGKDAVNTSNIVNKAVTSAKQATRIKWIDNTFGVNNSLWVDTKNKTLTFRSKASTSTTGTFNIVCNGYFKAITPVAIQYVENTKYFVQYDEFANAIQLLTSLEDNAYFGYITIQGKKVYSNFTFPIYVDSILVDTLTVKESNLLDNAVSNSKIKDKAITSSKLIPNIKWLDNTNGINNSLWIDTTNKTMTFRSLASATGTFNIVNNGVFKGVQPVAIPYADNTMYFIQYDETNAKFIAETKLNENYVYAGFIKIIDKGVWHNFKFPVYVDGNYTELNYVNTNIAVCNEPIEFDFVTNKVHFPQNFEFNCCNHIFTVSGQSDLTLDDKGYIVFNRAKGIFEKANKPTGDRISVVVGGYIKADNFAIVNGAKFTILSNPDNNYSTTPEIALFGDSVVAGTGCTIPFYEIIYKKSGIKMLNYGVGASGYVQNASQEKKVRVGQGKCELGIVDYPPLNNTIPYRIQTIGVNLPQKYIAIKAGINDFGYGVTIEDFKTAVRNCITMIYDADKTPIIITPQPILKKTSNYGIAMEDYITALKEVCEETNAIFIDNYHCNGINTQNSVSYAKYLSDSVHPNNNGHAVMACQVLNGLKNAFIM